MPYLTLAQRTRKYKEWQSWSFCADENKRLANFQEFLGLFECEILRRYKCESETEKKLEKKNQKQPRERPEFSKCCSDPTHYSGNNYHFSKPHIYSILYKEMEFEEQ